MIIKVMLFASAKELVGQEQLELVLEDEATVGDVKTTLAEQYPPMRELIPSCTFSVDEEYSHDNKRLYHGCEVGCIPPVSGG